MPDDGLKEIGAIETPRARVENALKAVDTALTDRAKVGGSPETDALCTAKIFELQDGFRGVSPTDVRAAIWPYFSKNIPFWESLLEGEVSAKYFCRPPDVQFAGKEGFEYWGNQIQVNNLPEGSAGFTAVEINGGVVAILDDQEKAVGILDINPRLPRESRNLQVEMQPVDHLFETSLASKVKAEPGEITEFLENYPKFFAQTGDFARVTGLSHRINLNVVPMEGKFLVYRQLKGEFLRPEVAEILNRNYPDGIPIEDGVLQQLRGAPENFGLREFQAMAQGGYVIHPDATFFASQDAADMMQFFYDNGAIAGEILKAISDRPELLMALVDFSNMYSGQFVETGFYRSEILANYCGAKAMETWITGQPRHSEQELIDQLKNFSADEQAKIGFRVENPLTYVPQLMGWLAEVEGFSTEMGFRLSENKKVAKSDIQFAKDLGDAIRNRTRAMACGFFDYLQIETKLFSEGIISEENMRAIAFFKDGINAQNALIAYMSMEGSTGLAQAINLPPFFFQEYRKVHAGNPEAAEVMKSVLDLWEKVYLEKEMAGGAKADFEVVRKFYEKHQEQISKGEKTGETAVEIARDRSIIQLLAKYHWLPKEAKVIDFGPWTGERRLRPFLQILKDNGVDPVRVVGIDISDVPNHIPEMELRKMSFSQAGNETDLEGEFNFAKVDWSAFGDIASFAEQIESFISASRCLTKDGILIIDMPFPEGQGSYDEIAKKFKELHPDRPEGVFVVRFDPEKSDPKEFYTYYYEIMIKFLEDAGFKILNLPEGMNARNDYFKRVIAGEENISEKREDAFSSPVWQASRPRQTIVAQKIAEVEESSSPVVRTLAA